VKKKEMPREVVLTQEGFEKLKNEIDVLRTEKRREIAERIKEAREFGDISENAEYDHAKNEQAMLEARISQLEDKLRSATIVDDKNLEKDVVSVGSWVRVKDQKSGKSVLYQIVGSAEAEPSESKLSNESPVGRALIGHRRGDVVTVAVPRGPSRKLKITKIEAA
jgi:transcription elongation factor GreA